MVEAMAAYGIPETDIAKVAKIDPKTLRKHYRDELDLGLIKANAQVGGSLFRKALGDGHGSTTAAIFWLKTRAGWKEAADGNGVTINNNNLTINEGDQTVIINEVRDELSDLFGEVHAKIEATPDPQSRH